MKLRSIAILFAFAVASASAAYSQAGVYAIFDAEQFTRNGIVAEPAAGASNSDQPFLYGPTVGAFYMISKLPKLGTVHTGPVAIGIDGRGDFLRTAGAYNRTDGIISLRLTPKKQLMKTTPYIQGGAGIGHTKVPGQFYFSNNWSYQFAAGLDRKIKGRIDWRVVEVTGGFLGSYAAGLSPSASNHLLAVGTGLVVHLP